MPSGFFGQALPPGLSGLTGSRDSRTQPTATSTGVACKVLPIVHTTSFRRSSYEEIRDELGYIILALPGGGN